MIEYTIRVDAQGTKFWYLNGKLHREDGPAVERSNGSKFWYLNGKVHREDGPAVEYSNGSKEWWLNHKRHREDGPAVDWIDGTKRWYFNGELIDSYIPNFGCAKKWIETKEQALDRLDSKRRPYSRELYLRDIEEKFD